MYSLTQMYYILLLFYCWLLVSASMAIFRPIFTKKTLQMLLYRNVNLHGIQFRLINILYNYYQISDVLSVVSCVAIICCENCECISRIFPLIANLKILKIIKITSSFKIYSIMCSR